MDVQQDHIGGEGADGGDGALDVVGLGDDLDVRGVGGELGAHPGAHQGVIVDDEHPQDRGARRRGGIGSAPASGRLGVGHDVLSWVWREAAWAGSASLTSVPLARRRIRAVPPYRSILPMMDSRTPCLSGGASEGSKPGP